MPQDTAAAGPAAGLSCPASPCSPPSLQQWPSYHKPTTGQPPLANGYTFCFVSLSKLYTFRCR